MPIHNHFLADLPKGLRALAAGTIDTDTKLEWREFLKLATASGFALGLFPVVVSAQARSEERGAGFRQRSQAPPAAIGFCEDRS